MTSRGTACKTKARWRRRKTTHAPVVRLSGLLFGLKDAQVVVFVCDLPAAVKQAWTSVYLVDLRWGDAFHASLALQCRSSSDQGWAGF